MTPRQLPALLDRRLLLAAAALGGIVVGLLVMRLFSSDGDDLAVGIAPQAARVPAQTTTTVPAPVLSADTTAALASPRDPFGQIVTVPEAQQATSGTQAAPALAAQAAGGTPRPQTTVRAPSPSPTTTTTAPTPPTVQAVQPPPAAPAPAATTAPTPVPPNVVWGTVGPVAVPGEPVNVCVVRGTTGCSSTAPATSITLTVAATIDAAAVTRPTVLPGACSNGRGAALLINTGSAGTVIHVSLNVTVNGSPTAAGFSLPAPTPNEPVIISACVAPGVGVPSAGTPAPPPPTGGLVDGLLPPLLGLLGGGPVPATSGAAPTLLGLPLA